MLTAGILMRNRGASTTVNLIRILMGDSQEAPPSPEQVDRRRQECQDLQRYRRTLAQRVIVCSKDNLQRIKQKRDEIKSALQENELAHQCGTDLIKELENALVTEKISLVDEKADLVKKNRELQALTAKLRKLEKKISRLVLQEKHLTRSNSNVEARLNAIREILLAETASFEKIKGAISLLRRQYDKKRAEVEKQELSVKESVVKIHETKQSLEELENEMADLQANLIEEGANLHNLSRRKERLLDQERSLHQQLASLETLIFNLRDEIQCLEIQRSLTLDVPSSGILSVQWGGKNNQPEREELTIKINGFRDRLDSALDDKNHCRGEISKIKEEYRAVDTLFDTTQVKIAKNEAMLNNKTKAKNRKEETCDQLNEELHEGRMELQDKELSVEMLEDKIVLYETQRENSVVLISSLEDERKTAEAQKDCLQQQLPALNAKYHQTIAKITDLKCLICEAEKKVNELQRKVAEKERKVESLRNEMETCQCKILHLKEEHQLHVGRIFSLEMEKINILSEERQIANAIRTLTDMLMRWEKVSNLDFTQYLGDKKTTKSVLIQPDKKVNEYMKFN